MRLTSIFATLRFIFGSLENEIEPVNGLSRGASQATKTIKDEKKTKKHLRLAILLVIPVFLYRAIQLNHSHEK